MPSRPTDIDAIVDATTIPWPRWDENAHTRRILTATANDIVVRGRPEVSGRLKTCLPIGTFRSRAYRVTRPDLINQSVAELEARPKEARVFISRIRRDGTIVEPKPDTVIREGAYRQAFPEDLAETIRLNGNWSDAEQDDWLDELPTAVLDSLQRDLALARAEAASHHKKETVGTPSTVAS